MGVSEENFPAAFVNLNSLKVCLDQSVDLRADLVRHDPIVNLYELADESRLLR